MTLPDVFKTEGLDPALTACVHFVECAGRRKAILPIAKIDWTKAIDGCWYAQDTRFTPAIAKLGDLEGAFEFVGRNRTVPGLSPGCG